MNISNGLFGFTGRMEKKAYQPKFITMLIINWLSGMFLKMGGGTIMMHRILGIAFLLSLVILISLLIRRFRDIKSSPWWIIPSVIIFGIFYIVGIILCFKDSKYE